MGVVSSKIEEEDKALQLCRERKKYVRQALDGRCSLAAAYYAYIQSLRSTGIAFKKIVQPEVAVDSSLYTSTSATPEPNALTDKSLSQFSYSSRSANQHVDPIGHFSPTPPPASTRYHAHHMKFKGSFTRKVVERPPSAVTVTVTSSSTPQTTTPQTTTPQTTTPRSYGRAEAEPFEASSEPVQESPWDFFVLTHPIDTHFSSGEQREVRIDEDDDYLRQIRHNEALSEIVDEEDKISASSHGEESSEEWEFEEEPSSDSLVRKFENFNRGMSLEADTASPSMLNARRAASENELLSEERLQSPKLSPLRANSPEVSVQHEAKTTPVSVNTEVRLPPIRTEAKTTPVSVHTEVRLPPIRTKAKTTPVSLCSHTEATTPLKDEDIEHKVAPKDFFSSMREVEYYFQKASDSGREVPKMLEANKLHFRPILPGQEFGGSTTSALLKACFSCGDDPSEVREEEEPTQPSVMYLTWHRTESSRSFSSTTRGDIDDLTTNLFDSFSMISGSHASTLDRLYAWERKLYDEVKDSRIIRRDYDMKCNLLRQQESKDERKERIDKTRSNVKDLHNRIRVAIQRIDSVSKRIEDLRDNELQPQLEELIEGLRRMWEIMSECHRLQVHIVTISCSNDNVRIVLWSESQRHFALQLQGELSTLASSFTKWIGAHKLYIQSINNWLVKCAPVTQKQPKKRRRFRQPLRKLSDYGPPIYTTCEVWLEKLENLPTKKVSDAIKGLVAEIGSFIPHHEKGHGKKKTRDGGSAALDMLNDTASEDLGPANYDQLKPSLVMFLSNLSNFAECSVNMYGDLQKVIQDSKRKYEHMMSQP